MKNYLFTMLMFSLAFATIGQTGPVAHYPFNGNTFDESGNGNDGVPHGNVLLTQDRFENLNSAYDFDGIDGWIEVTHNDDLDFNNIDGDEYSAFCWIKTFDISDYGRILTKHESNGNDDPGYYLETVNGQLNLHFESTPGPIHQNITGGFVSDNAWHHVGFTLNATSNEVKLYLDGAIETVADISSHGSSSNTFPFSIGSRNGTMYSFLDGIIDDVIIYNRLLSESEIQALYLEDGWNPLQDGLVSHYPFNGNANDESGNGYHLTENGAVLTDDRFGNINNAYYFDGNNSDLIDNVNYPGFGLSESISLVAWIMPDNVTPSEKMGISGKGNSTSRNYDLFITPESKINYYVEGLDNTFVESNTSIQPGEWYFIVGVYDYNQSLKIFINGILDAEITASGIPISSYTNFAIGCQGKDKCTNYSVSFEGKIDDVRLYNRPLSPDEVEQLYLEDVNNQYPPVVDLGYDVNACEGETVTLDAGNPDCSFLWSTGETNQTIDITTSGNYSVEVSNSYATATDDINVLFNSLPIVEAGDTATIYIGYSPIETQLTATGGVDYLWSPSEGLSDPNISNPIAQPGTSTLYTVTASDENGCINSDEVFVIVIDAVCGNNLNKVLMCHVLPNGNTKTVCVSPNAVPALVAQGSYVGPCYKVSEILNPEESKEEYSEVFTVNAFPNPFKNNCTIEIVLPNSSEVTYQIYDVHGRTVDNEFLGKLDSGTHTFEWQNNKGSNNSSIYYLKVITELGTKNLKLFNK